MREPSDSVSAATDWPSYLNELAEAPWAHDFFATLRRLETLRPDLPTGWGRRVTGTVIGGLSAMMGIGGGIGNRGQR